MCVCTLSPNSSSTFKIGREQREGKSLLNLSKPSQGLWESGPMGGKQPPHLVIKVNSPLSVLCLTRSDGDDCSFS